MSWYPPWGPSGELSILRAGDETIDPRFAQLSHASDIHSRSLVAVLPAPGVLESAIELVVLASVYCDWDRWQV